MILVRNGAGESLHLGASAFMQAVALGHVHPAAPVSLDAGRTFLPAAVLASRLQHRGDDVLAAVLPTRVETFSALAGYIAVFSGLFLGGPFALGAAIIGFESGPTLAFRIGAIALALVLGPLPPALAALAGLRAIRRDPTLRGKGRAIFALVIAGLMLLGCLAGGVGVIVTIIHG